MMAMTKIVKSSGIVASAVIVLSACNVLDVNNPNNLTEESLASVAAADAVTNGAQAADARSISQHWLAYLIAADEIVWIGSRDAWGQLDYGFVGDPNNEFSDDSYKYLSQARWMADRAVTIVDGHVADPANAARLTALKTAQAKAYLHAGLIYTIIGETQEDFVLSDKQDAGSAVGPTNMKTMLDKAIEKLTKSMAVAQELNNTTILNQAQAMRARARHSRLIWDKIKPTVNAAQPLVSDGQMVADANAVIGRAAATFRFQMLYGSSTVSSYIGSEINSRGEQQFDTTTIITVNKAAPKTILGVKLKDPIDNKADPRIQTFLEEWKGDKNISVAGGIYPALTVTSTRAMRLLVAEDALAKNDLATFTTQINAVRAMDGLTAWSGQIPALDMLKYERRAGLFLTGVRLLDMYRFGIKDPVWQPNSDTNRKPGTLLPITCIERNANPNLTPC